jgi:hypothetical protein
VLHVTQADTETPRADSLYAAVAQSVPVGPVPVALKEAQYDQGVEEVVDRARMQREPRTDLLTRSSSTAESRVLDRQNLVPTSMMCDGSSPAVEMSGVLSRFCLMLARLSRSSAALRRRRINSRYSGNDSRSADSSR